MTKQKIRWIIFLMSLALLGLIAFQAYWLGYMLVSKEENFAAEVRSSLDQVVRKLEKQELLVLAERKKSFEFEQEKERALSAKLVGSEKFKVESGKVKVESRKWKVERGKWKVESEKNRQNLEQFVAPSDFVWVQKQIMLPNGQIAEITEEYQLGPDLNEMERRLQEQKKLDKLIDEVPVDPNKKSKAIKLNIKVDHKKELAKELFSDFLFKERPIQQRFAPALLDSLIKFELSLKGIRLPFYYGIFGAGTNHNNWVFLSNKKISKVEISPKLFSANLFPNDLHPTNHQLKLYFPGQRAFIWETMGMNFAASFILLLIVMVCFYWAVSMILKQKKLAEVKNDFINNMTHEFKTPISTISLATQLIQEEPEILKNNSILKYLGIIREENTRLGNQVERVLQTAQMEKEEIVLKKKNIDLKAMIEHIAEANGPVIFSNHGKLHLDLPSEEVFVQADEVHLSNVVFNLIDNAVKYSENQPDISISLRSTEKNIQISIQDKGIGISKEVINNIFEPFYRVHTGNVHNVKGFGLGLSYVKKIVEAHDGKVLVKSKLGDGSTFEISLPKQ